MEWYEAEVRQLEQYCKAQTNGTGPPVFYGSSSIRLWKTLAEDVDPIVLNLGFGGSTMEACDYFFERLIPPVHPLSLLVYAGDNDLGDGRSVEQVFGWYQSLANKVSEQLVQMPFGFISIKPSPARLSIIDKIRRVNELIHADIAERRSAYYVDVFPAMLDAAGEPQPEFFAEDGLHLSREGYKVWARILKAHRNEIFMT